MATFTFHACFDGVVPPVAADPAVFGTQSFRAVTFCEPFRSAAGFGWYAFPPIDFMVKWNGASFHWLPAGGTGWLPLTSVPVQTLYRARGVEVPDDPLLHVPALLSTVEPGLLQIWSGLVASSPPEWSLLLRNVPNLPGHLQYEVLDGIIETGWWHGPLFTTMRFRRTDEPVTFSRRMPMVAYQPVLREAYLSAQHREIDYTPPTPVSMQHARRLVAQALSVREEGNPGGYRRQTLRRRRADRSARIDGQAPTRSNASTEAQPAQPEAGSV
jgi:hypothetical protein